MLRYRSAPALLSLPNDTRNPTAYEVFGLRAGESDPSVVAQAIRATIQRLNEAKPQADGAAWRQAAGWVKAARDELLSRAQPQVQPRPQPVSPANPPVVDPLADLLPRRPTPVTTAAANTPSPQPAPRLRAGKPIPIPTSPIPASQPAVGNTRVVAPIAAPTPPPMPPPPSVGQPSSETPATASPDGGAAAIPAAATGSLETDAAPADFTAPVIELASAPARASGRRTRKRGTGFSWVNALLMGFALACLGAVVGLVYVMSKNPSGLVINLQSGAGSPGEPNGPGESTGRGGRAGVAQPPAIEPPARGGGETDRTSVRTNGRREARMAEADDWVQSLASKESSAAGDDVQGMAKPAVRMNPEPMGESPADSPPDPSTPAMDIGMATTGSSDPGMTAAGEAAEVALAAARDAFHQANWQGMVEAAAAAAAAAVTPEQKRSASRLSQLVELATYYHGGIEAGLQKLKPTESFQLTDQVQVVIVEITSERVVVRFAGRNKEYTRDELPLVMVHKIVRFALPTESPVVPIAAEIFQAIAPVSTPQHRDQAIRNLERMTEEVDGILPADLAEELREWKAP